MSAGHDELAKATAELQRTVMTLQAAVRSMREVSREPIAVSLAVAADMVGCSSRHLRDEWRAGRISLKNKGSKAKPQYVVLVTELERWVDDLPAAVPRRFGVS